MGSFRSARQSILTPQTMTGICSKLRQSLAKPKDTSHSKYKNFLYSFLLWQQKKETNEAQKEEKKTGKLWKINRGMNSCLLTLTVGLAG